MTKEVIAKALLLDMKEKLTVIVKGVEKADDLLVVADLYDNAAKVIRETDAQIKELEAEDGN
jgi:hypothetical protein